MNHLTLLDIYNATPEEEQQKFLKELGIKPPKKKLSKRERINFFKQLTLKENGRRKKR